jgi:hypothetical protein
MNYNWTLDVRLCLNFIRNDLNLKNGLKKPKEKNMEGISMKTYRFILKTICLLLLILSAVSSHADIIQGTPTLQNGDIIFQKSVSNQSPAVGEAQGSPWSHVGILVQNKGTWYVAESRKSSLDLRTLAEFINSGVNGDYVIKRVKSEYVDMSALNNQSRLQQAFDKYKGKSYDVFFEWSNERIYCSELASKVYYDAFGIQLGTMQKIGDLNLDGPAVKKLIKDRLDAIGKKLNKQEPILTPASLMADDEHLVTVIAEIKKVSTMDSLVVIGSVLESP